MTERFYSIKHLSTEQLRELYATYIKFGWVDVQFYRLTPDGEEPPKLSDGEIILNLDINNEHNYCVLMIDYEDEEDGIMIGFGMTYHPDFAVYLHLPLTMLDELVQKYELIAKEEVKNRTITEHLTEQTKNDPLN